MTDYDVIVVGSGAGGGTAAHTLAHAGKRILILERGGFLPREPDNWNPAAVFVDGKYVSRDRWFDRHDREFQPQVHYFVGGATKLYGAALFRLRPRDFTDYARPQGTSPAWPLTYDDMEPWYTAAEWMYQVHGEHGNDPTEGWHSKEYPHPPVSHEARIEGLHYDLHGIGLHPFHAPCGVLLDEAALRLRPPAAGGCVKCAMCDGYPCPLGAKADAETIAIRPILSLPNVTLKTHARVTCYHRSLDDPTRIASVEYYDEDEGTTERATADQFVLSAGAVNSAVILLRSDLPDRSRLLGRNYMSHVCQAVIAIGYQPNDTRFQKTLALHDFYRDYGSIQMLGRSNAAAFKSETAMAKVMPDWSLKKATKHAVEFWLQAEDLPSPVNRVLLSRDAVVLDIKERTGTTEMTGLYGRLVEATRQTGLQGHTILNRSLFMHKGMPLAAVAHQAGTCKFGVNAKDSVLDINCRMHGLGNLYVVDASFMPSVGAVNPALTIMANALRVSDHIARQ